MSSDLAKAAETAVEQCLRVAPGESVVVVTDDKRAPIGEALYEAVSAITDDATILRYPPADQHGTEPPAPVAAAMAESDAFLAPTTKSLSHTRARGAACDDAGRAARPFPDHGGRVHHRARRRLRRDRRRLRRRRSRRSPTPTRSG